MSRFFEQVYRVVRCIPPGQVASYGQVAAMLGNPHAARTVGWAMHALPEDSDVPWQRVINAQGRVSTAAQDRDDSLQRQLLEAEGVVFGPDGRVNMARYRWQGLLWPELHALLYSESQDALG
ncbi:MAG: MGMT family protein [Chloroflexota bacterium]